MSLSKVLLASAGLFLHFIEGHSFLHHGRHSSNQATRLEIRLQGCRNNCVLNLNLMAQFGAGRNEDYLIEFVAIDICITR
jgi:hypothetical protein